MGPFTNHINRLKKAEQDLDKMILEVIKENEHLVIDSNLAQLEAGIQNDSKPIEPAYTPFTVRIKREKGQPFDRVTLKDEGDFHGAFFVVYYHNYFALGSDDPKTKKLVKKYGPDIFGLNEKSMKALIDEIREPIIEKLKKAITE